MYTAVWLKRARLPEVTLALTYEQHGFFEQAQLAYEQVRWTQNHLVEFSWVELSWRTCIWNQIIDHNGVGRCQARREPQWKLLLRGSITTTQPHSVCTEIQHRQGTYVGRLACPLTIRLGVWWSVVTSCSGVRKMDFMYIWGLKEAIWNTLFSIFEQWRAPQMSWGPGKLSPFPLSRRAWAVSLKSVVSSNSYVFNWWLNVSNNFWVRNRASR